MGRQQAGNHVCSGTLFVAEADGRLFGCKLGRFSEARRQNYEVYQPGIADSSQVIWSKTSPLKSWSVFFGHEDATGK